MPTKRRVLIFLIVLSIMLFAKYVWGQDADQSVGWDPVDCNGCGDASTGDLLLVMIGGPIVGLIAGLHRVHSRNIAAKAGRLYERELIRLQI
jgi:hypothetical protein